MRSTPPATVETCEDSGSPSVERTVAKPPSKAWLLPAVLLVPLLIHLSQGLRIKRVPHPDEIWTMNVLMSSTGQLVGKTVLQQDNHPPLYYLLSKGWIELTGATIPHLRWLSFLFTALTLVFLVWSYRRHPRFESAVVLGLIGTNPLLTYFTVTVRPYSLVVLLATIMTWSALRLNRSHEPDQGGAGAASGQRKSWAILYYGSAFLLGITHYFGTLYVLLATIIDLFSRRIERSPWKGMLLLLLIILWPLLQTFTGSLDQQAQANSWVNVFPLISTVNNFLAGVFPLLMISRTPQLGFGVVVAMVLLLVALRPFLPAAAAALSCNRGRLASLLALDPVFLSVLATSVVIAGWIADSLLPFTTPYYFLVCLPPVTILLGRLISASSSDRFRRGLSLFFTLAVVVLQIQLAHQRLSLP